MPLCLSQSSRLRSPACASALEAYQAVGRKNERGVKDLVEFLPSALFTFVLSIGSLDNIYGAPSVSEDSKTEQDTHPVLQKLMVGMGAVAGGGGRGFITL